MACRRSSRIVSKRHFEVSSEPLKELNAVSSAQKRRQRGKKNLKQKVEDTLDSNQTSPSSETDFSSIEKKIFEGTEFGPNSLFLKYKKRLDLPSNGESSVRECKENALKDASCSVQSTKEVQETTQASPANVKVSLLSQSSSSFEKRIKENSLITRNGRLKTWKLNPEQIIELVKAYHPRASEILPKLTTGNPVIGRSSTSETNAAEHADTPDVSKEAPNAKAGQQKSGKSGKGSTASRKSAAKYSENIAEDIGGATQRILTRKAVNASSCRSTTKEPNKRQKLKQQKCQSSESEQSDWEDVGHKGGEEDDIDLLMEKDEAAALNLLAKRDVEAALEHQAGTSSSNAAAVQIELDAPSLWGSKHKKRNSDEYWMMQHFRHGVNRNIRENYLNCHKVHLLLLLGHGMHVNRHLNSEELLAPALSIVTNKDVYPPERISLSYLEQFARWYAKEISRDDSPLEKFYWLKGLDVVLKERFEKRQAKTSREFVFMFVLVARALGMNVRLIQSINPMYWRPSLADLFRPMKDVEENSAPNGDLHQPLKEPEEESSLKSKNTEAKRRRMLSSESENELATPMHAKKKNNVKNRPKFSEDEYSNDDNSDSDFDEIFKRKKTKRKSKHVASNSGSKSSSGSKSCSGSSKSSSGGSSCKRSLSENFPGQPTKKKKTEEQSSWAEIYVEEEERWVCVDVIQSKIHYAAQLANRAPSPVAFVTAFNVDQSIKDVTRRYVHTWLAFENKLRGASEWWKQVLVPYAPSFSAKEKAENQELEESLRQQPLPKTIAEYKNHKMFVLQRHLLKFEALYPPNPDPVGFVKGEAVYPRECVYLLHSRDIWKREGKTVKVDEEPYKIVKARPKWDRATCQVIKDLPLEIFGPWQVKDYQPPVARNGRVPRNEYGNVELFQKWMLPVGTVHLDASYEDLSKVARRLKIDCAPTLVGFDCSGLGPYLVFDGYIVCEEFKDILLDAWKEEMVLKKKREEMKRQRRIYGNWKRLIHGMLVKHHVREKYGQDSDEEATTSSQKTKAPRTAKPKKKIKQSDIDAQKSATEEKVQLGVDLSSDTVAMARKSLKDSYSSRGMVRQPKTAEDEALAAIVPKQEDLILDSDEDIKETEEEKKEKLRKILAWNNSKLATLPNLSDDSGAEEKLNSVYKKHPEKRTTFGSEVNLRDDAPSCHEMSDSDCGNGNQRPAPKRRSAPVKSRRRVQKGKYGSKLSRSNSFINQSEKIENNLSEDEESRSTIYRRLSTRRGSKRKSVSYKESEDSDISLDESDLEDKTYKPVELAAANSFTRTGNGVLMPSEESEE